MKVLNNPRRIGVVSFLGASVLVVAVFGHREQGDNVNPHPVMQPGPNGASQVVLKANRVHQYVANGRINGEPVEFLIDTGAADVVVPYQVAQRLNLRLSSGGLNVTGNGSVQGWTSTLNSVDIGGLTARSVRATVLPNMLGDQILLGMAYLKEIELSLARGEMTLRAALNP